MLEVFKNKREINREPQKIRDVREVRLPNKLLTIEDINKHLKDGDKFQFLHIEEGMLGLPIVYLIIHSYRDETKEEIDIRIEKTQKYYYK